jgi:hypothetical protein
LDNQSQRFATAGEMLVQGVRNDIAARRRQALVGLELLVAKRGGRVRQAPVIECSRRFQQVPLRNRRRHVVLAGEAAADVARTDAQLQHHRRIRDLRQGETLFDHAHHVPKFGTRIEQDQRRFERVRSSALLDHAGALAVILPDDDQRAPRHTR